MKSEREDKSADGVPWWPSTPTARIPLSRDRIVAAAVRIVDRDGLSALTMRRLSSELGSGVMSIYKHVRDRDELIDLAVDEIVGRVAPPRPGYELEPELSRFAIEFRRCLVDHPGISTEFAVRTRPGPNVLRLTEATLATLREAGIGDVEAVDTLFALSALIGHVGGLRTSPEEPSFDLSALGAAHYPNITGLARYFSSLWDEDWLKSMVHVIVVGLQRPSEVGEGP